MPELNFFDSIPPNTPPEPPLEPLVERFRAQLLSPALSSQLRHLNKLCGGFQPGIALRFKDGARSADVLLCFACGDIKAAGDPSGVLNPGCKIALAGDQPIGELRHDPDATPLDPRARAALDTIERERGWARFRLEVDA